MAQGQRDPGLLSNVLTFVSHEIGSFVLNAAGLGTDVSVHLSHKCLNQAHLFAVFSAQTHNDLEPSSSRIERADQPKARRNTPKRATHNRNHTEHDIPQPRRTGPKHRRARSMDSREPRRQDRDLESYSTANRRPVNSPRIERQSLSHSTVATTRDIDDGTVFPDYLESEIFNNLS
jgi:hypothetical protein